MKKLLPALSVAVLLTACKTKKPVTSADGSYNDVKTVSVVDFVPSGSIIAKFKKDFPNSTRTIWTKSATRAFVDFKNSAGFRSQATYGFDGTLLENQLGMDLNKLPLTVKNYLNTKYPNHEVLHAYTVRQGISKKYMLVELKGTDNVLFDLDGNFLNYKP